MFEEFRLESTVCDELIKGLVILQDIDPASPRKENLAAVRELINENRILAEFCNDLKNSILSTQEKGYFLLDSNKIVNSDEEARLLNFLLVCCAGEPIWLFNDESFWFELGVKLDADPGRTHGVGENKLHVDMVGYSRVPRLISFHSMRKDLNGGGMTLLADMEKAIGFLSDEDIKLLSSPHFKYWHDEGVREVGTGLDQFPVIDHNSLAGRRVYRFTSKMDQHFEKEGLVLTHEGEQKKQKIIGSFTRLSEAAEKVREEFVLQPGQILIFDQLRFVHGRGVLGPNQQAIPEDKRRLISQCYAH
ncbi:TauD/TfdA family dioxygenase [Mesobacillus zeae]|uniref:TauD/TfdA-like domain-containing protein n=1 Tax=Mesobacillus zeae TaxID=1917180 RepID=A0A398BGN1_9BACI|nr:TauD/TfdA family dioxygenase [Mesobacillus zeae]RID88794.1 hypothetical protein D1970_00675 [Mesobacillus zeae]